MTSKPIALVAEDDMITRMDVVDIFERAGYETHDAANAREAWDFLSSRDGEVILLLTDVEMPGEMNGLQLANKVHDAWPHVEIVVCSGRLQPSEGELPKPATFLGKPVDSMTLEAKARETVEKAREKWPN